MTASFVVDDATGAENSPDNGLSAGNEVQAALSKAAMDAEYRFITDECAPEFAL